MQERSLYIKNRLGLHARPAALFVQLANRFQSQVRVAKDTREADGKSIMGLLMLAAEQGCQVLVTAAGKDEVEAMEALAALIERQFDEE
ncbi:MAG: HPr family phosphocarrier protein [Elusimicrobia bacterium]|nr:HPr family phosphocarrier protein [Elusimicrobiota bacterium]